MQDPWQLRNCGHNFCRGCLDDYMERRNDSACPTCKTPGWRRDVMRNATLASVLASFLDFHRVLQSLGHLPPPPQSLPRQGQPGEGEERGPAALGRKRGKRPTDGPEGIVTLESNAQTTNETQEEDGEEAEAEASEAPYSQSSGNAPNFTHESQEELLASEGMASQGGQPQDSPPHLGLSEESQELDFGVGTPAALGTTGSSSRPAQTSGNDDGLPHGQNEQAMELTNGGQGIDPSPSVTTPDEANVAEVDQERPDGGGGGGGEGDQEEERLGQDGGVPGEAEGQAMDEGGGDWVDTQELVSIPDPQGRTSLDASDMSPRIQLGEPMAAPTGQEVITVEEEDVPMGASSSEESGNEKPPEASLELDTSMATVDAHKAVTVQRSATGGDQEMEDAAGVDMDPCGPAISSRNSCGSMHSWRLGCVPTKQQDPSPLAQTKLFPSPRPHPHEDAEVTGGGGSPGARATHDPASEPGLTPAHAQPGQPLSPPGGSSRFETPNSMTSASSDTTTTGAKEESYEEARRGCGSEMADDGSPVIAMTATNQRHTFPTMRGSTPVAEGQAMMDGGPKTRDGKPTWPLQPQIKTTTWLPPISAKTSQKAAPKPRSQGSGSKQPQPVPGQQSIDSFFSKPDNKPCEKNKQRYREEIIDCTLPPTISETKGRQSGSRGSTPRQSVMGLGGGADQDHSDTEDVQVLGVVLSTPRAPVGGELPLCEMEDEGVEEECPDSRALPVSPSPCSNPLDREEWDQSSPPPPPLVPGDSKPASAREGIDQPHEGERGHVTGGACLVTVGSRLGNCLHPASSPRASAIEPGSSHDEARSLEAATMGESEGPRTAASQMSEVLVSAYDPSQATASSLGLMTSSVDVGSADLGFLEPPQSPTRDMMEERLDSMSSTSRGESLAHDHGDSLLVDATPCFEEDTLSKEWEPTEMIPGTQSQPINDVATPSWSAARGELQGVIPESQPQPRCTEEPTVDTPSIPATLPFLSQELTEIGGERGFIADSQAPLNPHTGGHASPSNTWVDRPPPIASPSHQLTATTTMGGFIASTQSGKAVERMIMPVEPPSAPEPDPPSPGSSPPLLPALDETVSQLPSAEGEADAPAIAMAGHGEGHAAAPCTATDPPSPLRPSTLSEHGCGRTSPPPPLTAVAGVMPHAPGGTTQRDEQAEASSPHGRESVQGSYIYTQEPDSQVLDAYGADFHNWVDNYENLPTQERSHVAQAVVKKHREMRPSWQWDFEQLDPEDVHAGDAGCVQVLEVCTCDLQPTLRQEMEEIVRALPKEKYCLQLSDSFSRRTAIVLVEGLELGNDLMLGNPNLTAAQHEAKAHQKPMVDIKWLRSSKEAGFLQDFQEFTLCSPAPPPSPVP